MSSSRLPPESYEGTASRQISGTSAKVASLGSKNLDHGEELAGKHRRDMSEHSIQLGEMLPYRGKVRSMIKKLLPWSRKEGNDPNGIGEPFTGAIVGDQDYGCEIVHKGEGDIHAE